MDAATRVFELAAVRPHFRLSDVDAVDLATKATGDTHRLLDLVSGELLRLEEGRCVVARQTIRLANEGTWDEAAGVDRLGTVAIDAAAPGGAAPGATTLTAEAVD